MVDHILKISRPGVFDIRCLSWNTASIVFMKRCCMDRRRYESRHWIPMFETPCTKRLKTQCPITMNPITKHPKLYTAQKQKAKCYKSAKNKTAKITKNMKKYN